VLKRKTPLLPGATVMVRSWAEISRTLDTSGSLDALPFMPEMLPYCGRSFTVSRRLERTCEELEGGMRRIQNIVLLEDLRCTGEAHGGCHKGCMIFWKEAWLTVPAKQPPAQTADGAPDGPVLCTKHSEGYFCQSTELLNASAAMPAWDLRSYYRDIRSRTYTPLELLRIVAFALYLRFRRMITGKSYRVLQGHQNPTPTDSLDLKPGEWVTVKSKQEIEDTLDSSGKNQGLAFTVEMLPFCGKSFRVLRRLERMVLEPTRELIPMKNTVLLEGATCDGCHILRGGCPRENFHFWREIWLRRRNSIQF
jgi:hypothetical protein